MIYENGGATPPPPPRRRLLLFIDDNNWGSKHWDAPDIWLLCATIYGGHWGKWESNQLLILCKGFALSMWEVESELWIEVFDLFLRIERLDGGGWIWFCSEHLDLECGELEMVGDYYLILHMQLGGVCEKHSASEWWRSSHATVLSIDLTNKTLQYFYLFFLKFDCPSRYR